MIGLKIFFLSQSYDFDIKWTFLLPHTAHHITISTLTTTNMRVPKRTPASAFKKLSVAHKVKKVKLEPKDYKGPPISPVQLSPLKYIDVPDMNLYPAVEMEVEELFPVPPKWRKELDKAMAAMENANELGTALIHINKSLDLAESLMKKEDTKMEVEKPLFGKKRDLSEACDSEWDWSGADQFE